jgi:hypothetical protein
MKRIPLTKGKEALVDECDYAYLMQWKWFCSSSGRAVRNAKQSDVASFVKRPLSRQRILMHRVVAERTGLKIAGKDVDHVDTNPLNNQRNNLRPATDAQNSSNQGKTSRNTSGFKGVSWNKNNKNWLARICYYGVQYNLGSYATPEAAAAAYDAAAKELHKEFAYLNNPRA